MLNSNIKVGMDIGGTLTKIAIMIDKNDDVLCNYLKENLFDKSEEIKIEGHYIYLKRFLSANFNSEAIPFLQRLCNFNTIHATGGGAFKFYNMVYDKLQVKFEKHDELLSLVSGYTFMNAYRSFYEFNQKDKTIRILQPEELTFPHIAVNIGSGVSILEVKTPTEIRRLTGTMMGGGTLIGLSKLLINMDNYIDILNLAREGDNTQVDRLVGDIYGGGGSSSGLEAETISASFGKINKFITNKNELRKEDIAKSLLLMIVYHIGELAYLQAKQRNIDTIGYFGNFSRKNSYAIECLDYATKFWNADLQIRFNLYDGSLASIGSLVSQNIT